jgi:hypothetical protein
LKTTPSRSSNVKNHQKLLNVLFLNVILKTFQLKIKNQVMIAQRKILKTFQMKAKESCDGVGNKEDIEDTSNEGKEPSKDLDCNNDDDEFFSTSEEEDVETICVKFDDIYPMKRIEGNLLKLQKENEEGVYR